MNIDHGAIFQLLKTVDTIWFWVYNKLIKGHCYDSQDGNYQKN